LAENVPIFAYDPAMKGPQMSLGDGWQCLGIGIHENTDQQGLSPLWWLVISMN